jgi:triosephosphate isomerase
MIKPLVAGNWKMYGNTETARHLAVQLVAQWSDRAVAERSVEMVLFPPSVHLSLVKGAVAGSGIAVGAQNLSQHGSGAYTGEISGDMLVDQGCDYVLVGHSERRNLFGESSATVAEKFKTAQSSGLIPILCVGETLRQRQQEQTVAVVTAQIKAVIDCVGLHNVCRAVVAYEPVWAIGTGETASPEQAQQVHRAIRNQLGEVGLRTRLLYGGSVKASNAAELFGQPDINGGLVGGASLEAIEFFNIVKRAE